MAPTVRTFPLSLKAVVAGVPAAGVVLAGIAAAGGGFTTPQQWRWVGVPALPVRGGLAQRDPVQSRPAAKGHPNGPPRLLSLLLPPPRLGPPTPALRGPPAQP